MITSRFLRFLSIYLRITSRIFYAVPFQVDQLGSKFRIRMQQDPKSTILFTLNFSLQCETMIWSFLRLCQMHLTGKYTNIHPYVIHGFNLIGFGYPVILQMFLMLNGELFCSYFNQSVAHDKELREKYLKRKKTRKMDLLELGTSTLLPAVYFQAICFGMYSLMKPSKAFFHCSLLMDLGWSKWSQLPVKIYECYMFINCWHVIVSTWLTLSAATYSNARWPMELFHPKSNAKQVRERKTLDELRSFPNSLVVYQRLFMLCCRFNQLSKFWISALALYSGKLVAIYMGFATIKLGLEQTLPIMEYMAYPSSCLFLIALLGFTSPEVETWHESSKRYIRALRWDSKRLIRKSVRAMVPMAAWIGDFFPVHKGFGMEALQHCVVQIGDLVISVEVQAHYNA